MEPTLDETLLTAYLDGELTSQDRQLLEQRLANEPELRQRMTILEETWHYLDFLEQDNADANKIEATLKTAAISLSTVPFPTLRHGRLVQWGIALLVGLAMFIVPFQFGKRSLFEDSSFCQMIERLDKYRAIIEEDDGLELLQRLTESEVFLPEIRFRANPLHSDTRRKFNDAELYQVLFFRNLKIYEEVLSHEEREQIHKFHRTLIESPNSIDVLLTLQNYIYWHRTLPKSEKDALKQKTLDEKVVSIIGLVNRNAMLMPSMIIGTDKSKRLAEILASAAHREQILKEEPLLIIHELFHLSEE